MFFIFEEDDDAVVIPHLSSYDVYQAAGERH